MDVDILEADLTHCDRCAAGCERDDVPCVVVWCYGNGMALCRRCLQHALSLLDEPDHPPDRLPPNDLGVRLDEFAADERRADMRRRAKERERKLRAMGFEPVSEDQRAVNRAILDVKSRMR